MGTDAFVSHSSSDVAKATQIVDQLESKQLTCWIAPRNIALGSDYGSAIVDGIKSSKVMIVLLSKASVASKNVAKEVERAHALDIPLLTVRLEDVALSGSLEYFLASTQFVDGFPLTADRLEGIQHAVSGALTGTPAAQTVKSSGADRVTMTPKVLAGVLLAVVAASILWLALRGDGGLEDAVNVVGSNEIAVHEKSWFWTEAPPGSEIVYSYQGNDYVAQEFWLRATSPGPARLLVSVTSGTETIVRDISLQATEREPDSYACELLTDEEVTAAVSISPASTLAPDGDFNECQWSFNTESGQGEVLVGWHRGASGEARLKWFTESFGSVSVDGSDLDAVTGSTSSATRVMAMTDAGLLDVRVSENLGDALLLAVEILELLNDRASDS